MYVYMCIYIYIHIYIYIYIYIYTYMCIEKRGAAARPEVGRAAEGPLGVVIDR